MIETEKSGGKKSPILASLENLRKDIGTYSNLLMLNAKTYQAEIEAPKQEKNIFKFCSLLEKAPLSVTLKVFLFTWLVGGVKKVKLFFSFLLPVQPAANDFIAVSIVK